MVDAYNLTEKQTYEFFVYHDLLLGAQSKVPHYYRGVFLEKDKKMTWYFKNFEEFDSVTKETIGKSKPLFKIKHFGLLHPIFTVSSPENSDSDSDSDSSNGRKNVVSKKKAGSLKMKKKAKKTYSKRKTHKKK